ncbi:hypothetical protein OG535_14170 [Kitasatospora sp. NBC_00085]|uniref:hypothetical protein n=1 Tax=unclassified Kitasatospora TaxID=2633591 RepID=UPI00324A2729
MRVCRKTALSSTPPRSGATPRRTRSRRLPRIEQVKELAVEISPEQIDKADADWVFYGVYGTPSSTNQDAVLDGPLWKTLGAVTSGQARPVSDETWFLGLGVTAANAVLADLKNFVAPGA